MTLSLLMILKQHKLIKFVEILICADAAYEIYICEYF